MNCLGALVTVVVSASVLSGCAAPLFRDGEPSQGLQRQSDLCRASSVPSVANQPAATSYDRCMERFSGAINGRN